MISGYIPFDYGAWVSDVGVECKKHGLQYGGMSLRVQPTRDGFVIVRKYCGLCVIDILDVWCTRVPDTTPTPS